MPEFYRRRPSSPDSPQPARSLRLKTSSLFPREDTSLSPLRVGGLIDYLKHYNQSGRFRLQIWTATQHSPDHPRPEPQVVRFIIRDVVTFYMILDTANPDSVIIVESATAFGSREKVHMSLMQSSSGLTRWPQKPPHSQSDYIVFQRLSQHLAKMLQSYPQVPFQSVMVRDQITQLASSVRYASAHIF